jgi:hypothetical protein
MTHRRCGFRNHNHSTPAGLTVQTQLGPFVYALGKRRDFRGKFLMRRASRALLRLLLHNPTSSKLMGYSALTCLTLSQRHDEQQVAMAKGYHHIDRGTSVVSRGGRQQRSSSASSPSFSAAQQPASKFPQPSNTNMKPERSELHCGTVIGHSNSTDVDGATSYAGPVDLRYLARRTKVTAGLCGLLA